MITEHIHREFFNINAWNAVNRKTIHSKRMFRTACTTLWGSVAFQSDMCLSSSNVLWRCSFLCWATDFSSCLKYSFLSTLFLRSFLLLDPSLCNQIWFRKRKHSNINANVFAPFAATAAAVTYHTHKKNVQRKLLLFFLQLLCYVCASFVPNSKAQKRKKKREKKIRWTIFSCSCMFFERAPF